MEEKLTEKLAILNDKVDSIQHSVNQMDKDLEGDRETFQQVRITMADLVAQVDELRKQLKSLVGSTQDKIADVIAPLQEQIEDKKIVQYKPLSWFNKFKNKVRG